MYVSHFERSPGVVETVATGYTVQCPMYTVQVCRKTKKILLIPDSRAIGGDFDRSVV